MPIVPGLGRMVYLLLFGILTQCVRQYSMDKAEKRSSRIGKITYLHLISVNFQTFSLLKKYRLSVGRPFFGGKYTKFDRLQFDLLPQPFPEQERAD